MWLWRTFPRQMLQYVTMWAATSPGELTTKENARLARNYWFQAIPLQKLLKVYSKSIKSCSNGKPWRTCRASAFCFATTVFAMQFFNALSSNAKNTKRLLTLNNARAVFTNASTAVANASRFCDLTDIKCSSDHTNFKFIVRTVLITLQRTSGRNSTAALL